MARLFPSLSQRYMRTTLNLSADALAAVRQLARQRGKTLGAIASELILQALRPSGAPLVRNGVPIFAAPPDARSDAAAAAPDLDLVNRLRDQAP